MSYFYYQVFKNIQSQLSTLKLVYLQILQILFYIWSILLLFEFHKIYTSFPLVLPRFLIEQLLLFLLARYLTVYIRHRIYLLTPTIKNTYLKEDRQLLINEIEESLQKSLEFTKWSCGILSTVLVLVVTIFFNVVLKIFERTISDSTLTKELESMTSSDAYNLFLFFISIIILIVGIVLAYYFIIQLFSFHKRLVLKILKNCDYHSSYYLLNSSKWMVVKELTKEAFLWNYIKYFF